MLYLLYIAVDIVSILGDRSPSFSSSDKTIHGCPLKGWSSSIPRGISGGECSENGETAANTSPLGLESGIPNYLSSSSILSWFDSEHGVMSQLFCFLPILRDWVLQKITGSTYVIEAVDGLDILRVGRISIDGTKINGSKDKNLRYDLSQRT